MSGARREFTISGVEADHPIDALPEYAAGQLEAPRCFEVEEHLLMCPMCMAWAQELAEGLQPAPEPLARVSARSSANG